MVDERQNYQGLEVHAGFVNRTEYGFIPLNVKQGGGCIYGINEMHKNYLGGKMPDDETRVIDGHLLECRRCENTWDALTSRMEEPFTRPAHRKDEIPDDEEM